MIVIVLVLLALGVALFIMLSDTRRNNGFKKLEQAASGDTVASDAGAASTASCDAGGDGGGGCD